jgi:hypothetical protein
MNPTGMAASIDVGTQDGHNLRAILLRMADGELIWNYDVDQKDTDGPVDAAWSTACDLGLVCPQAKTELAAIGLEVAELLRPKPLRVHELPVLPPEHHIAVHMMAGVRGHWAISGKPTDGEVNFPTATCILEADARDIADLLDRRTIDRAKQYRTEPTP